MKKRAVLERLKEKYIRAARTPMLRNQSELTIELSPDDFPRNSDINYEQLGQALLSIEDDYSRMITIEPPSRRSRREYYRVKVSANAFPEELISKVKFTVVRHDGYWCLVLPGEGVMHRIGRVGSLKGELFAALGRRIGTTINPEALPEIVRASVTDPRTDDADMTEIRNALREINRTMHAEIRRRLHLAPRGPHVEVVLRKMENLIWNADIRFTRGQWRVGIVKD
ncbi:hypothetical protein A2704_05815 [Candidatus Kaiserbacteria bacterium RIFCSPHIGHO2_01_FULL_54_36b]|uniref:Uncharacterized protein n=1 Tax=Candidatus Kaiserbacteria bacterium RIFCSPHIGHO2_01_FULL_54_36b TaxID=1798483 RepID=A0A1F6CME3_9BACT|nr:MAG: hypothetical protein A2704_05815 [Candidatus Kaiserbacteria bacterium RIFCSPHIGHO2_01_FULL_54_36b]